MTTNPYFTGGDYQSSGEQNLMETLIIEQIKIAGHTMIYLPRTLMKEDMILGEDTISKFSNSNGIEMYLDNYDAWQGQGDMIAKFGLQIQDNATFTVSKKRFREVFPEMHRPREGDLIYFPRTKALMEITFVEHENPFFQLGKLFVYKITAELYQYSHETFDTGNIDIDRINEMYENDDSVENDAQADNEYLQEEGQGINSFDPDDPFKDW